MCRVQYGVPKMGFAGSLAGAMPRLENYRFAGEVMRRAFRYLMAAIKLQQLLQPSSTQTKRDPSRGPLLSNETSAGAVQPQGKYIRSLKMD
jgi:hypothetical protein